MRRILVSAIALSLLAPSFSAAQRPGGGARPGIGMSMPTYRPEVMRSGVLDDVATARRQAIRREEVQAEQQTRIAIDAAYERDPLGHWRRRGEIVMAAASPDAASAAQALGLAMRRAQLLPASGLILYTFAVPAGARAQDVVAALRAARPGDAIDLNFVYDFEGGQSAGARFNAVQAPPGPGAGGRRIAAVIDSSLPIDRETLAGVTLRTERFGPGPGKASAHALAVAAILADTAGHAGLTLLAADVSEAGPLPGASAASIAQALDWAAGAGAQVVNISLTGPPNAVLAIVVRRIAARGVVIVAAAGNAGPRAPAPYPAALPEVVGVTAVDRDLRIWRRATQGPHVDFSAQGVKVTAAGGEWSGTSLASPVVAGVLLRTLETPEALARQVRDLGAPGRDTVFGFGFVAGR